MDSIESSKFLSHKGKILRQLDSRKDSHPQKLERKPKILLKLSLTELCYSKLSGLSTFDMAKGINQRVML